MMFRNTFFVRNFIQRIGIELETSNASSFKIVGNLLVPYEAFGT